MKQIALNIEQMNHLESLGLDTSDASMEWQYVSWEGYELKVCNDNCVAGELGIPAYTLQDILEKLPNYIFVKDDEYNYHSTKSTYDLHIMPLDNSEKGLLLQYMNYECKCKPSEGIIADDLLEASYQMLLWCIENNYIKTNKV